MKRLQRDSDYYLEGKGFGGPEWDTQVDLSSSGTIFSQAERIREKQKKMERGIFLGLTAGVERKDLATWFGDVAEKKKGDVHTLDDCYASTIVILAMAVGFFSIISFLESSERLESEHHLITALSLDSWPGVLQMIQKRIKGSKVCGRNDGIPGERGI